MSVTGPSAGHLDLVELLGYVPQRQLRLLGAMYVAVALAAALIGFGLGTRGVAEAKFMLRASEMAMETAHARIEQLDSALRQVEVDGKASPASQQPAAPRRSGERPPAAGAAPGQWAITPSARAGPPLSMRVDAPAAPTAASTKVEPRDSKQPTVGSLPKGP